MSSNLQLLTKLTIGRQELKNRVVLAPMTRARCENTEDPFDIKSSLPNDLMVEYFTQRASAGLLITDATAFSEEGYGWRNAPAISSEKHAMAWKKVTDAVHEKGGLIYLQLWHMGRQAHSSFHPKTNRTVSASNIPMKVGKARTIHQENVDHEIPHALTVDEIKTTIDDYVNGARLCKKAGFDGVEVHGANGYLIDQFLQSCSNQRDDEYGGSFENRFRFLKEIIEALIADGTYPADRIGVRLSPNGNFGDMGGEDNFDFFPALAETLNQYGLAYLHIMDGLGFGYHNKCKAVTPADIRSRFDGPIICNVELTRDVAEGMIRSGACDAAAYGRLYISNPDLVERFAYDWPVEKPAPYETWWRYTAEKGYTDWPVYKPTESAADADPVENGIKANEAIIEPLENNAEPSSQGVRVQS